MRDAAPSVRGDAGSCERVAVVLHNTFPTPADAGTPRMYHLLRQLRRGAELHGLAAVACGAQAWGGFASRPEVAELFTSLVAHQRRARYSPLAQLATLLSGRGTFELRYKDPEALRTSHQRFERLVERLGALRVLCLGSAAVQLVPERYWRCCVVDVIDPRALIVERRIAHDPLVSPLERLKLRAALPSLRRAERRVLPRLGGVCFVSDVDAEYMRARVPGARILHVPDGGDATYFADYRGEEEERADEIVFVGDMGFPPNADAAFHLVRDILPLIWERRPQVTAYLVGARASPPVQALHDGHRVVVTGYVDDVRPYLRRAAVVVSALRFGAGMKNKLQAGLAMAKAMVVTRVTAEGFHTLDSGTHAIVADEPREFADAVCSLLDDPARRRRMGAAGRELILRDYTWDAAGARLRDALAACPRAEAGSVSSAPA